LSYEWKPWTIDGSGNWALSPVDPNHPDDVKGAWVPVISNVTTDQSLNSFISVAEGSGWKPAPYRVMPWKGLGVYDGTKANELGKPVYFYTVAPSFTNAGNPNPPQGKDASKIKFLVVLNPVTPSTNNYALVPPKDSNNKFVQVTANIPSDKTAVQITERYPFKVTTSETATITKIGDQNITCKLALSPTTWNLTKDSDSDCNNYFVSGGNAGDIQMKYPTNTPPVSTVSYTLVPPQVDGNNVQVEATIDGVKIPFSENQAFTFNVKANETKDINVTQIGDTQLPTACELTADSKGWRLSNQDACSQYFTTTQGDPNSNITLVSPKPVSVKYTLVALPDNTQVTAVLPDGSSKVFTGSYPVDVTSPETVTITQIGDNNNLSCPISLDTKGWQLATDSSDDCGQYFTTGTSGGPNSNITMTFHVTPPPPPEEEKSGYYVLVPAEGSSLTVSTSGNVDQKTWSQPNSVRLGVSSDSPVQVTVTASIGTGDQTKVAVCTLNMSKTAWSVAPTTDTVNQPGVTDCGKFPVSGTANTATDPAVIGVGMPDKSPVSPPGYYVLVPAEGSTLSVSSTGNVDQKTWSQPNSVRLGVSTPVQVTVTASIGSGEDAKTAVCTLNMSNKAWSVAPTTDTVNQPGVTDCGTFPVSGTANTATDPAVIGVGMPDKSPAPVTPPPPTSGTGYYFFAPGAVAPGIGDTLDITTTTNSPSSNDPNGTYTAPFAYSVAPGKVATITITIHSPNPVPPQTCTIRMDSDKWEPVSGDGCIYLSAPPRTAGKTIDSQGVIGIGVP
ncbi:MAG: hypothetical protein WBE18_01585, partial [Gammaproteobacteria bacterium]